MRRGTIKILALLAFIASAWAAIRFFGVGAYLDPDYLRARIGLFGPWGPVLYIFIYSISPSLMVPGLPLTLLGGVLFGPVRGSLYVITGATIGSAIPFLIARYMGRQWVESKLKGRVRLEELDGKVQRQGWKIVALTRLIPFFPYNFLNYAFGLTRIKFVHYLLASFIFMAPGAIAYVVFSSSIIGILQGRFSKELIIGAVLLLAVLLAPVLYKRLKGAG